MQTGKTMETKGNGDLWDNKYLELIQVNFLYQHITPSSRKGGLEKSSLDDLLFIRQ